MELNPSDYKKFKKSKPWGYYPPEVHDVMDQYESELSKLKFKISELEGENNDLKVENARLVHEISEAHYQISSLEVPPVSEGVAVQVMDDFKKWGGNGKEEEEMQSKMEDPDELKEMKNRRRKV